MTDNAKQSAELQARLEAVNLFTHPNFETAVHALYEARKTRSFTREEQKTFFEDREMRYHHIEVQAPDPVPHDNPPRDGNTVCVILGDFQHCVTIRSPFGP